MLLRWNSRLPLPQSPLKPEPPVVVLAAPGSIGPRQRVTQALAAGSLLVVGFRPVPRSVATAYLVTNVNPSGSGSLLQAVQDANAHPGPDTVTFQAGLTGTIFLAGQITISDSVQIIGPGPGALAVSGNNLHRVFYLTSTATLTNTTTISGLAIRDGRAQGTVLAPEGGDGAGILADGARLTLDNVALLNNTAISDTINPAEGGGVDIEDGATTPASLTIRNSLISGNHADKGGGVYATYTALGTTITNTQVLTNSAAVNGGGVAIDTPYASTLIEDSTIAGNTAGHHGGGIWFHDSGDGHEAQAIRRTTISGNSAVKAGGLYIGVVAGPFVIENSTISGNHASTTGGGIVLYYNYGHIAIQNTTVTNNSAVTGAGGVEVVYDTVPITDTIIAGNLAPLNQDISGTFELRYDLVQVTGTATVTTSIGNVFGLDPQLGPLADNGGPTQTHLPAHSSPAANAGDPAFAPPPATDQRGRTRVVAGQIDIGAVETQHESFLPFVKR